MDDVISISSDSGSDEDTEEPDVEFVGSYKDEREDAVPFIRAELLAVTPVLIDITGHHFSPLRPRRSQISRRGQSSTIEVIDLNNDSLPTDSSNSDAQLQRITADHTFTEAENGFVESSTGVVPCGNSQCSPRTVNLEKDVIYLDTGDAGATLSPFSVSSNQNKCSTDQYSSVNSCLEELSIQKKSENMHPCAPDQFEIEEQAFFDALENLHEFHTTPTQKLEKNVEELPNTKDTQKFSSAFDCTTNLHKDEKLDSPQSWLDKAPSPFSLDSPYYCPSEIDAFFFSDESNVGHDKERSRTCSHSSVHQTESTSNMPAETTDLHENGHAYKLSTSQAQSEFPCEILSTSGAVSPTCSLPCAQPCSPTSTEILAGDSPDTLASSPSLTMESPPSSPCLPSLPSPLHSSTEKPVLLSSKGLSPSSNQWTSTGMVEDNTGPNEGSDYYESQPQSRQHISLVQFKKLKRLIGGGGQDVPGDNEEEEDYGPAEPLCRQGLSLVYSTIEENYPEGTLQLLSDFIQPRYYPPVDITAHLLRQILLDPQCAGVLALEAFNLLMRTQKYHPADVSRVPWDWELLSSVMAEQDEAGRLQSEGRCLLFQYVLQVLEDDFYLKLKLKKPQLQLSIAKAMLSCHEKFRQVRDLMNWLLDAARQSFSTSDDDLQIKEKNCCLKMLLILQRMLVFAMEVDRTPTCSSSKLSQELCNSLNSTAPSRKLRLLLLSTLESNLLRCKLLELLLDQACSQKKPLPMSLNLVLHFLQTSTLAPDPSDGTERWRRWDELLKLVWMLTLSYEEVVKGHLRCSITERFTLSRPPMWTHNDHATQTAVQEAADAFSSRAVKDLGHALPSKIQESLSQLQEHLLSINLH